MFHGVYTALVTPFRDGKFDRDAFARLIEGQIAGGVAGIVPVGTTGESPTLDHGEHTEVIRAAAEIAKGRCTVIGGTGSNATSEAVELTREGDRAGADALLLVAPYYNKPSQEGLFRHFAAVASATPKPVVLYSIPGRCGIEIGVETVRRLAEACPNIVALKESGGSIERINALRAALPETFSILSGDDNMTLACMALGASGVVSVASNILPAEVVAMVGAFQRGDASGALAIHRRLYPLFRDLFIEPNPVPAKTALAWLGRMAGEVRLPLCPMSEPNAAKLRATLQELGLL